MGTTVALRCPACGSKEFIKKPGSKAKDPKPRAKCGRLLTQNDVRRKAVKIAHKMVGDALSKVRGFKRR